MLALFGDVFALQVICSVLAFVVLVLSFAISLLRRSVVALEQQRDAMASQCIRERGLRFGAEARALAVGGRGEARVTNIVPIRSRSKP